MNPYISNHQFNQIRHKMAYISSILKFNSDPVIVSVNKEMAQEEIENIFESLSGQEKDLLQMSHLSEAQEVTSYLEELEEYTYGMTSLTDGKIKKLFPKEKKLKLPSKSNQEQRHTYLGWHDQGKKKLYIAYSNDNTVSGMVCMVNNNQSKNMSMCSVCGHMNDNSEVLNVTVKLKKNGPDSYHTIGFNICKNSGECNQRIEDPSRLINLLKKANK